MKTPIRYYGGKQKLVPNISQLIQASGTRGYAEVFAGGAAVFFGKKPSAYEILNDMNGNVANFYKVMKLHFTELREEIETTLHDEYNHRLASAIYKKPDGHSDVKRAWAFWVACNLSYGGSPATGFQYVKNKTDNWTPGVRIANYRNAFKYYADRLERCTIMNRDALEVIAIFDNKDLLIYADPPYVGANQGHYSGYKQEDFDRLLERLENGDSKFILSSYPNKSLEDYTNRNHWNSIEIKMRKGVLGDSTDKIEVLTFNFDIEQYNQQSLF